MQKRIVNFIKKHYLCSISCCDGNRPWSNAIYYVFDEKQECLIYITTDSTYHAQVMCQNPYVSGVIAMPTRFIPSLQGVQFTGIAKKLEGEEAEAALRFFKKSFSHHMIDPLSVWAIDLEYIKLTDRSLGLYGKVEWHKGEEYEEVEDNIFAQYDQQ
ncbi:pyridoxamine 5'-phosphate oxidase family protein [Pasteurella sp. PK-2025]|uniref:pyridoxamine 5'-phosphate oxidase family protein n=1 Tax=Pasteurella sp. PK-2025 TaxID=3413133 RepID=UPI003C743505